MNGCASYGSHLGATALPSGSTQLSLNADVLVIDRGLGPQILPNPELGYRFGVRENLDWGGRVNAGSLEVNGRWQVARGRMDVSLVPGLGFGFVPVTNAETGLFNAHLLGTLLAGLNFPGRKQLIFGARGALTYAFPLTAFRGNTAGDNVIYLAGGVLGLRLPLGKQSFLLPEINVLFPYDSRRREWQWPTMQAGVSFDFE